MTLRRPVSRGATQLVGYTGGGGDEFMKPEFSFPVRSREILDYGQTVEQILKDRGGGNQAIFKRH